MRILACNDDGIDSPGLELLADAAAVLDGEVWIVAPERKWTAASHQLSFDRDLTLTQTAQRVFSCSGAPADCVVAAMTILFADGNMPDLVVAGVNDGRNVAEDIAYSGTMAIGREAAFWKIPAIAFSLSKGGNWGREQRASVEHAIRSLWNARRDWADEGCWLSVNLAQQPSRRFTHPRIGRDKIARASDVIEKASGKITYRIRRGRSPSAIAGDENAMLDAGSNTIVRYRWFAEAGVSDTTMNALNAESG